MFFFSKNSSRKSVLKAILYFITVDNFFIMKLTRQPKWGKKFYFSILLKINIRNNDFFFLDIAASNLANFGTQLEKDVRAETGAHEQAWADSSSKVGQVA